MDMAYLLEGLCADNLCFIGTIGTAVGCLVGSEIPVQDSQTLLLVQELQRARPSVCPSVLPLHSAGTGQA